MSDRHDHLVGPDGELKRHAEVQRFDLHQRIQHGLMASSFTLLVLTGWPLTTHGVGASHKLVEFFGGLAGTALLHRIAAVAMIISAVYHAIWLVMKLAQGRLPFSMLPTLKDAKDVLHNFSYFLGLRKDRPRFPRYSYFEKFDYWAVFWGVTIMAGSGFIRWFPDVITSFTPAWVYEIALHAHADEGLLAALAIFVWHFYNVHLRPSIFPMSWVFITGRMTLEELEIEHGAEYDDLVAGLKARQSKDEAEP
ncbi:MAG: cytochrome b/b6 domain-containing protein [Myxococcales bacterium]|nr:cytochrome b/b6 domain-containing protein [Myxococcales bacterium]